MNRDVFSIFFQYPKNLKFETDKIVMHLNNIKTFHGEFVG